MTALKATEGLWNAQSVADQAGGSENGATALVAAFVRAQVKAAVLDITTKAFNPAERRDSHGRWTRLDGSALQHIKKTAHDDFEGWSKFTDKAGNNYHVGKDGRVHVGTDHQDNILVTGKDKPEAVHNLDDYVGSTLGKKPKTLAPGKRPMKTKPGQARTGMHFVPDDPKNPERTALGVPPAWFSVQIADNKETAKVLAIGRVKTANGGEREAAPIYSAEHNAKASVTKHARVRSLHKDIPKIDKALAQEAPEDDTAAVLHIIRQTGMRPGGDRDTGAAKESNGALDLQPRHVTVSPDGTTTFKFLGKSNKANVYKTKDPVVAKVVRARMKGKKPNEKMFDLGIDRTKKDSGKKEQDKLRNYLRQISGKNYTTKDFRTYHAHALALKAVQSMPVPKNITQYKRERHEVGVLVSNYLNNTPTVALAKYIDPAIFQGWRNTVGIEED